MFCNNCGNQLTGTENVCPQCGTPVTNVEQQNTQPMAAPAVEPVVEPQVAPQPVVQPVEQITPEVVMPEATPQQVTSPVAEPQVAPQPVVQPAMPVQNTEANKPGGPNKKVIIIAAAIGVIAIIGIVLWLVLGNTKTEESGATTDDNNKNKAAETEVSQKTNKIDYNGYTLELPDGYESETDPETGLIIASPTIAYTIQIDYTNSYDDYKNELAQTHPEFKDEMETEIEGRKYLGLIYDYTEKNGKFAQYVTAVDKVIFTGFIVKVDYSEPAREDFSEFNKILATAKKSSSTFAAGDSEDAGKDGILDLGKTKPTVNFNN